ncbi:hypothetical protein [Nocardia sp. SSK8]|uniref:hypothetical protein n=1 Tax=Nocardia sp. SSK8 TaxID=3120154 RepID=UPI0030090606
MSNSPIEDLVAEHLRRVRMLRVEFEDERARLQAKGDALLAAAQAAEQRAAEERAAEEEAAARAVQPEPDSDEILRREAARREWVAPAPAEQRWPVTTNSEVQAAAPRATEQRFAPTAPPVAVPGPPQSDDEAARREAEQYEAREAIARSIAARRAAAVVEPVDYDGYDQESEYFRGKNWFG